MARRNEDEENNNSKNVLTEIFDYFRNFRLDKFVLDIGTFILKLFGPLKFKLIAILIIILIILIVAIVLLFWGTSKETFSKVSEKFKDVENHVTVEDKNIVIDEDYLAQADESLEAMGIDIDSLGFSESGAYVEKFLEAQIVTDFPYMGGDDLQGTVYFERANTDGTVKELQYIDKAEFDSRVSSGDSTVVNYFTLDTEDWTVHVIKNSHEGINTDNVEKIDYRSMVSKFSMPFEFPLALALISQNPQFSLAVVDLVKESRMVVTIAESEVITEKQVDISYDQIVTFSEPLEPFIDVPTTMTSHHDEEADPQPEPEYNYSTNIFLSEVRSWISNQVTDTVSRHYSETLDPQSENLPDEEETTTVIRKYDGAEVQRTQKRINRVQTTTTTMTYNIWETGTTKVIDKISNFTELIIKENGTSNGSGLVAVAKECHDYLSSNDYYYPSSANISSGQYVTDSGGPVTHKFPERGENMSQRYVDCSAFVSWVLREAGYDDVGLQSSETLRTVAKDKGWQEINSAQDLQPGDIVFYSGHVNIFVGKDGDRYLCYDCGSTNSIRATDPISYKIEGNMQVAYRPNDEVAQSWTLADIDSLQESIENYVSTIDQGDWSVSVRTVSGNDNISINNNDNIKTDGYLKMFVIVTAYNQVKDGLLTEEQVDPYVERIMQSGSGDAANSLIELIGNGDFEAGTEIINEYAQENNYLNVSIKDEFSPDGSANEGSDSNTTSVLNITYLMKDIYNNKCINRKYSKKMMEMLKIQNIDDTMIPETIESGSVYSRPGELVDLIEDSAIVELDKVTYVVAIKADNVEDKEKAKQDLKEISRIIYNYYYNVSEQKKLIKDDTNEELDMIIDGNRVCYRLPNDEGYLCPLDNLVEGSGMLFELLGDSEKTQNHETFMRYVLYLLTGDDYGVTEFDIEDMFGTKFATVVDAGDYVVKTDETNAAPVITDSNQLKQGIEKWLKANKKMRDNAINLADDFLMVQDKYNVNAVFMIAVMREESGIGTGKNPDGNYTSWVMENNWMSITATRT